MAGSISEGPSSLSLAGNRLCKTEEIIHMSTRDRSQIIQRYCSTTCGHFNVIAGEAGTIEM